MGRSGSVRSLLAAAAAACIALAPASVASQPAAAASRLEAHVWAHDGHPGPLAAGAADDFWTSSGSHYRFDGTKLGELQFSDRLAGKPEAIVSIRVGPRGQVFVAGIWPDLGFSLAAHDENGQQRWIRSLGRAGAKGSAKGPLRRGRQEEPSPKITSAEILGVDSEGDVQISGWLQGCVDLAPRPSSFVECATLDRAGKNFDADVDAFPELFFTSRFDESGSWKGSRAFPRLNVREVAWSSAGESLAATASGWWKKPLLIQAPAGTSTSIRFSEDDPAFKSIVVLLDRAGHLSGTLHLLAHEAQVVRSLVFDGGGWLWMLTAYSPGLEVRGPGRLRDGASVGNCLSLLSLATKDKVPHFRASYCTPNRAASFSSTLASGPDDRLIITSAPADLLDGAPVDPPPGLALPPPPRDVTGNVAGDYVPTRLVVSRQGQVEWSSPIPASHAIGLPNGWVCFDTPDKLACVRLVASARAPKG